MLNCLWMRTNCGGRKDRRDSVNQRPQATEKDKLEAKLYFLEKQANHAARAIGGAKSPKDREIAKQLLDSLSQEILELRTRIEALADSK
jgi:hypothetical protein